MTDKYKTDQYEALYRLENNAWMFVTKLNGRTKKQAIADVEEMELHESEPHFRY